MEHGRQVGGLTCCILVVVGVETVTDCLPTCLTVWKMITLEKLIFFCCLSKNSLSYCATWRVITLFPTASHLPLCQVSLCHSTHFLPCLYFFKFILISSVRLCLGFKCSFPSGFLTKTLFSCTCHKTHLNHLPCVLVYVCMGTEA